VKVFDRPHIDYVYVADAVDAVLKAARFGWRASTPLGEGLRRTCEWPRAAR